MLSGNLFLIDCPPKSLDRLVNKVRARGDFVSRYAGLYHIFGVLGAQRLIRPGLRAVAQAGRANYLDICSLDEVSDGTAVERVSALCLRGYTNNQLLRDIDAVSMAHSLEVRVPYLDPILLDFAMSLPNSAKLGDVPHLIILHCVSTVSRKWGQAHSD